MKLIKPYYKILTPINGEEIFKAIELAARTCYQSEGKIDYGEEDGKEIAVSARLLIPKLMNLNHEAMLEFGGMITVRFVCDRGVSHELVRHRLVSFAQESTRYCNYSKGDHITFIIPNWINIPEGEYKGDYPSKDSTESINLGNVNWFNSLINAEFHYNTLITDRKWTPQQARSVLPNSLKTEINVSANIREWRHIFKLRTAKVAHSQMRELMCPLLDDFKKQIPILFDDINY